MSSAIKVIQLTANQKEDLRRELIQLQPVFSISGNPRLGSLLSSLGIQQEVGTINDQLARYLMDADSGLPIPLSAFQADLIEYKRHFGVRIQAHGVRSFELRIKGLRSLLSPSFSIDKDGRIYQLVFFPESLASISALEGAELVIVKEWALNTVFGGFAPDKRFYETNSWELVENDALRYAQLLANRQIAFLGTHDLAGHISGLSQKAFAELQYLGQKTHLRLVEYFGQMKKPSVCSLVLPYAAGVLLDDLAQPGNYGAPGRKFAFEEIMKVIESQQIDPTTPRLLTQFPPSYERLILMARESEQERVYDEIPRICQALIAELKKFSFVMGPSEQDPNLSKVK